MRALIEKVDMLSWTLSNKTFSVCSYHAHSVGNVVKIGSNKEVIESILETEVEETERKMPYADIVCG